MQPGHPEPYPPNSPQPPESYGARTHLQGPRGGPLQPPRAAGHASPDGQRRGSMSPLREPGPATGQQRGAAERAGASARPRCISLPPRPRPAFPKSPHPLDISADQSTWRSARRQTPAVQSATRVPPLGQDRASERGTFLFLQRMLQAGVGRETEEAGGRETGGGGRTCRLTAALLWRPASHQQTLQPLPQAPIDCEDQVAGDLGCCPLPAKVSPDLEFSSSE